MPSRNNRIRARRALSTQIVGIGSDSDSHSATGSESDAHSLSPPPDPTRFSMTTKPAKKTVIRSTSKSKDRSGKKEANLEPGRLRRLLALLLLTTILLTLYHVFRLYTKGQGIFSVPFVSSPTSTAMDGKGLAREGGGMIPYPSPPRDNPEIKLEDLDMDTLQAAFDALYGDGGPLGPGGGSDRTQRRGDGSGEYRVAQRRKESLK